MKKEHIYLGVALAAIGLYFYTKKQDGGTMKGMKGFNVKINPNRLMDGTMAFMGVNPMFQEPIKSVANKIIDKIIG